MPGVRSWARFDGSSPRLSWEGRLQTNEGDMPRVGAAIKLGPLQPPTSSTLVADSLRRLIALGALSPGERLPSERELAEMLHVGRDSIRAAMRTLGGEELVETRRGRSGGTFVSDKRLQEQKVSEQLLAGHHEIQVSYEFRLAVEPAAARLAAQRAGTDAIQAIVDIAEERAWSFRSWRSIDSRFHAAVAHASGNPLFLEAVERTRTGFFGWWDALYSKVPWDSLPIQDRDIGYFHRPIAEAIAGHDAERAGDLMRTALEWSARDLAHLLDGFVAETTSGRGSTAKTG
jgi:GntR family transcriptional repressor for pyruvate dehydrogenase complex